MIHASNWEEELCFTILRHAAPGGGGCIRTPTQDLPEKEGPIAIFVKTPKATGWNYAFYGIPVNGKWAL